MKSIWLEFHVRCRGFTAFLAKSKYGCQKSHFLRWFIVLLLPEEVPLTHSSKNVQKLIKKIQIKILGPIIYYVNTEIFGRQLATQVRGPYTVTKDLILVAKWRQK